MTPEQLLQQKRDTYAKISLIIAILVSRNHAITNKDVIWPVIKNWMELRGRLMGHICEDIRKRC